MKIARRKVFPTLMILLEFRELQAVIMPSNCQWHITRRGLIMKSILDYSRWLPFGRH